VKRAARVLIAIAIAATTPVAQRRATPDPILLLISFDGWRWDYMDRLPTPNLKALAARGVRAAELIPSFPTFTFPNHYTIVTGLYPDHHGIVQNTIDELTYPERFTMSAATAREGRWWGGEAIWVTAERHGLRAAPMAWPGSEAPLAGLRPTAWDRVDDKTRGGTRERRAQSAHAAGRSASVVSDDVFQQRRPRGARERTRFARVDRGGALLDRHSARSSRA
jgi:hypothetical protein